MDRAAGLQAAREQNLSIAATAGPTLSATLSSSTTSEVASQRATVSAQGTNVVTAINQVTSQVASITLSAQGSTSASSITATAISATASISRLSTTYSAYVFFKMRYWLPLLLSFFLCALAQQGLELNIATDRTVTSTTFASTTSNRATTSVAGLTGSSATSSATSSTAATTTRRVSVTSALSTTQSTIGGRFLPPKACSFFYACKEVVTSSSPREGFFGSITYGLWAEIDSISGRSMWVAYGELDAATRNVRSNMKLGLLSLIPSMPNGCTYEIEDLLDGYLKLLCDNSTGSTPILPILSTTQKTTATDGLQCKLHGTQVTWFFFQLASTDLQFMVYHLDAFVSTGQVGQGVLFIMPFEYENGWSYINQYYGEKILMKFISLICNNNNLLSFSTLTATDITTHVRFHVDELNTVNATATIWAQYSSDGQFVQVVVQAQNDPHFSQSGKTGIPITLWSARMSSAHVGESIYRAANIMLDKLIAFTSITGSFLKVCGPALCIF